jgi:hypothetical protein
MGAKFFLLLLMASMTGMLAGCADNLFYDQDAQAQDKAQYFPDPTPIEHSDQGDFNDSGFVAPPVSSGTGIGGY